MYFKMSFVSLFIMASYCSWGMDDVVLGIPLDYDNTKSVELTKHPVRAMYFIDELKLEDIVKITVEDNWDIWGYQKKHNITPDKYYTVYLKDGTYIGANKGFHIRC